MYLRSQHIPLEREPLGVRQLKPLIGKNDPIIIEVGANVGQTTAEFLREMPKSRIFCFEPEPRAVGKFKERLAGSDVTLFECAVGNQNGVITFNQSTGEGAAEDWDQSGSIRRPKLHLETWPMVRFETQIEVPIVRLDDWALDKNLGTIDLIWADTQGAESDVIAGGASVLRNTRLLFIEYGVIEYYEGQASLDELCGALFELGLVLYRKFPLDALFLNKNLIDLEQISFPITRNTQCPCGSGHRYKHCHGRNV